MKRKVIVSICLTIFVVILMGCIIISGLKENDKMGCYVEQEIKEPELSSGEQFLSILEDASGNLTYYSWINGQTKQSIYQYLLVDGQYKKTQISCFDEFLKSSVPNSKLNLTKDSLRLYLGEDGQYYLLMQGIEVTNLGTENERYNNFSRLFQSNQELTSCAEVTPTTWNQKIDTRKNFQGTRVTYVQITSNGLLLYQDEMKNILTYSLIDREPTHEKKLITEYEYVVKGNTLCYIPQGLAEIWTYNYETGEEERYEFDNLQSNPKLQMSKEETIYLLDEGGLYYIAKGDDNWKTQVHGGFYSMGKSYLEIKYFILVEEKKDVYYALYQNKADEEEDLLACYRFDETVLPKKIRKLTIYSLLDNPPIRKAIVQYTSQHDDVQINYHVAINEGSGVTMEERIRLLNTEVLAGEGPDIFLMDGLPMEDYIEKGVLMDIDDIFMPMIEEGEIFGSIASCYMKEDAIYTMPLRFCIPIYMTSEYIKEPIVSVEQLSKVIVPSDKKLFPPFSYQRLLRSLLYTYYDDYVTDSGLLKENELQAFLEQVKIIADKIDIIDNKYERFWGMSSYGDDSITSLSTIIKSCGYDLLETNSIAAMDYAATYSDFDIFSAILHEKGGYLSSMNRTFIPNAILGINKVSKEAELAKDFIQFLFSEESQEKLIVNGLPMNAKVFESMMIGNIEYDDPYSFSCLFYIPEGDHRAFWIPILPLTYEELETVFWIIYSLETPLNYNDMVINIIVEKALPYFTGEEELDTVCKDIINKVNLYLSE